MGTARGGPHRARDDLAGRAVRGRGQRGPITNYDVAVTLTPEGVAEVTIDLRVDFASDDGHGIIFTLRPSPPR